MNRRHAGRAGGDLHDIGTERACKKDNEDPRLCSRCNRNMSCSAPGKDPLSLC